MRVTGLVLPVLTHAGWEVETVEIDLGTGPRPWIEIRHNGTITHVATVADRDHMLLGNGINPANLTETDMIDDGCE